jgi:hypothetical protein
MGWTALEIREAARLGISGGEDLLVNLGLWKQCLPPAAPKKCRVSGMLDFDRPPVSFLAGNQLWGVYRHLVTQAWNGNPLIQDFFLRLTPIRSVQSLYPTWGLHWPH